MTEGEGTVNSPSVNTVTKANALYAPVVDARDVVMSYLTDGVLIGEWWPTLTSCARTFSDLAANWRDGSLAALSSRVSAIAYGRLGDRSQVAEVSDHLAAMLVEINEVLGIRLDRPPAIPLPAGRRPALRPRPVGQADAATSSLRNHQLLPVYGSEAVVGCSPRW